MAWWFFRGRQQRNADTATATPQRFVTAGGRRYLRDAPYVLPKDLNESNRLNFQHYLLRQLFKGNTLAPIRDPLAILDVGSGTGRWGMEMAQAFPRANSIGVDLVAPPAGSVPTLGNGLESLPENYTFVVGNVLNGLEFADGSFDYVHMRLLYSALPGASWPTVAAELARVTKPGGWVEWIEGSVPPAGGPAMTAFHDFTLRGGASVGLDMTVGERLDSLLSNAGLTQVRMQRYPVTLGKRGGRMGTLLAVDLLDILKAGRGLSVAKGITTAEVYDNALRDWPREIEEGPPTTFTFYAAIGQRPMR